MIRVALIACGALLLAAAPASADTGVFSNAGSIAIPGSGTTGPASPYPTSIDVSGMVGPIEDISLVLRQVGHTRPRDIDVLLVSPEGSSALVMGNNCGADDIEDFTWTFDQHAGPTMDHGPCGGALYQPAPLNHGASLPAPAPAGPYFESFQFFGQNPNGRWKLYVFDHESGDVGDIETGWALIITTSPVDMTIPVTGTQGVASPYPATRSLSGETGVITEATVETGVSHERAEDLDVLLVGPHGQKVVLMSDACGFSRLQHASWIFDDRSFRFMPLDTEFNICQSGTFSPTDYGSGDSWPAPAPPGPYAASLAAFNFTDPNGEWRMYVVDDAPGATGYQVGSPFNLVVRTRPRAAVAFTDRAVDVAEGMTRSLTLTRTAPGGGDVGAGSVTVTAEPGSARSGDDFTPISTVLDFAAGEKTKALPISALTDDAREPDETFTVKLGSPADDAALGTPSSVDVTIPGGATQPGGGGRPGGGPGVTPPMPLCAGKRATIVGTARRDVLRGTRRSDVIVAGRGNDVVAAGRGSDTVCAGAGRDVVAGGPGRDRLRGGAGNDRLLGGRGRDRCRGGRGRDHLRC
jgi:subtilisin-like proprotein convertase family protein